MIRNLVFDFGGVLLDWNPHYVYDDYFGSREQADWFLANVTTMAWNGLMDLGRTFSECVAELQAQWPEWAEAIAVYQSRWFEMIGGEVEGMPQLLADLDRHEIDVLHSSTQIIIAPGYTYRIVCMMVTNFHQPQSTLLLLISAFVDGDWHTIYDYALANGFRFLSYGDSSLLFRR